MQALARRSPRTAALPDPDDEVVGISASGRTPYVIAAILEAPRRSALSVSVACNLDSAAGREADIAITGAPPPPRSRRRSMPRTAR
ncbi:SIS domain-containing protein [Curtobacterium sp. MCPF17_052]|uniref:SIS domain-containing protein n=1 Tax=Curtobacterium sp. MCPF17_052 TaxID=2175655 RepID=UPI0024DF87FE|nr:SIS domain-containing protein [Curtobacterium sp. MCPF17_052]WIB12309.1 SIS domain-containing protein [Curtobacterium sp. MCPF17_052]